MAVIYEKYRGDTMGSVADQVVRGSKAPVLVVPAREAARDERSYP